MNIDPSKIVRIVFNGFGIDPDPGKTRVVPGLYVKDASGHDVAMLGPSLYYEVDGVPILTLLSRIDGFVGAQGGSFEPDTQPPTPPVEP